MMATKKAKRMLQQMLNFLSLSSCDALLKMPLAVDHQGDQEASVGAALHRVYTRIYNDASAVLLNVPFSSVVDSNPFSAVHYRVVEHQSGWFGVLEWSRVDGVYLCVYQSVCTINVCTCVFSCVYLYVH